MVVERFESALWQTSSLLVAAGGEAVLVDPAVSGDEVARIATRARELGVPADVVPVGVRGEHVPDAGGGERRRDRRRAARRPHTGRN